MIDVFYSWQSRTNTKFNRDFIEVCIKKSIKNINREGIIFQEVSLERDIKGILGSPDIANTIFSKISDSSIFIGDVSFINSNDNGNIKNEENCNNNVLIELGYAAATLGWDNIICIFNSAYGKVEGLPFDIRSRRILVYELNHITSAEEKSILKSNMIRSMTKIFESFNEVFEINRRKVIGLYEREGASFVKLINTKPKMWGEKLLLNLLKKHTEPINYKIYEIENNLLLIRLKRMDNQEFWLWSKNSISEISKMVEILNNIFHQELVPSLSIENNNEMLIKFRDSVIRLTRLMSNVVDWKISLLSIDCPNDMIEIKESMLGWSKIFIDPLNLFIDNIDYAIKTKLANPDAEIGKIMFEIKADDSFDLFTQLMQKHYYKN